MNLISASRRTDIPAFYSRWFVNRIREGFCHWVNPFGGGVSRVSLACADVLGIVFWTRYPLPLLPFLPEIEDRGYRFYFYFTLTGYGAPLECHNPPLEKAVEAFRTLSARVSPPRVHWRYDPIILSGQHTAEWHVSQFGRLADALSGSTHRCYFSFVDLYGKTRRNLARAGRETILDPTTAERMRLIGEFRDIANRYGITLYACCEDALRDAGVEKARCVDASLLGVDVERRRKPTRPGCGCMQSIDIGAYDTCRFDCAYCYATNSSAAANRRAASHDPSDSLLWRPARLRGCELP